MTLGINNDLEVLSEPGLPLQCSLQIGNISCQGISKAISVQNRQVELVDLLTTAFPPVLRDKGKIRQTAISIKRDGYTTR